MAFWYFISYASRDFDKHLKKLHEELSTALSKSAPVRKEDAGFFANQSIRQGNAWEPALADALRTSLTLICICSPEFLASEWCGKELQVFLDRIATRPGAPVGIFPILWGDPAASRHASVNPFQYARTPPSYVERGLWDVARRKKRDFDEFVSDLAREIAHTAQQTPVPQLGVLRPFAQVGNALAGAQPAPPVRERRAHFAFFAPSEQELAAHRHAAARYGPGRKAWRPFEPTCATQIGILASAAANREDHYFNEVRIEDLHQHLEINRDTQEPTIVVIDPWSVRIQSYRATIQAYDYINPDYNAVLVTWNSPDEETATTREGLKAELRNVLRNSPKTRLYFRDSIESVEQLQAEIVNVLAEVRNRLISASPAAQTIEAPEIAAAALAQGYDPRRQPQLQVPGESPK